jgi:haloacetate dehalogenase
MPWLIFGMNFPAWRPPALFMMDHFTAAEIETGETKIFVRSGGRGPAILFLHGFPETHLMWRDIAPLLAERFTVVCADLRGYGRSGCSPTASNHLPYSKRVMADDMIAVMERLGFGEFSVVGHDRGARVAYRLALDHAESVNRLAVLDIVPTENAWARADAAFALGYWPWSLLAQPAPLPERMIAGAAETIVEHALGQWGTSFATFPAEVRAAYVDALQSAEHAHAICEEYRAAATIDREHDQTDRAQGHRIRCPLLVLWSARGALEKGFAAEGGPLGVWQQWADRVEGHAVEGGHFFPEEMPELTAGLLGRFFS